MSTKWLVGFCAIIMALSAPWPTLGGELLSARVLATGTQICPYDGRIEWTSPYSVPIRVHRVVIWHGMDIYAVADVTTVVYRAGPPHPSVLMSVFHQDRYANPSGPTQWVEDFGDHWVTVPPFGVISSRYICYWSQPPAASGNHTVYVWFTME